MFSAKVSFFCMQPEDVPEIRACPVKSNLSGNAWVTVTSPTSFLLHEIIIHVKDYPTAEKVANALNTVFETLSEKEPTIDGNPA